METITLSKFLTRYYNITNNKLSIITHDTVKELLPELKRCSFDYVDKNPDMVSRGEILMVTDSKGRTIPYIKPHMHVDPYHIDTVKIEKDKKQSKKHKDIEDMTNYELKEAVKECQKVSSLRKIKKELERRNINKSNRRKIVKSELRTQEEYEDYEEVYYGKH